MQKIVDKIINRSSGSWLLYGPQGVNKTITVWNIANKILNYKESCTSFEHENLLFINDKKKIQIDSIKKIKKFILQTTINNTIKIIIIDDAHNMNINSSTALLKILEEPPKKTIVLLTTIALSLLPSTIRSRCIKIMLAKSTNGMELVNNKYPNIKENIKKIALIISNNSPTLAIKLLDNNLEKIIKIIQSILNKSTINEIPILLNNITNEQTETIIIVLTYLTKEFMLKNNYNSNKFYQILKAWDWQNNIISNIKHLNISYHNAILGLLLQLINTKNTLKNISNN